MYKTFEAIYDKGNILPINFNFKSKKAKLMITIIKEYEDDNNTEIKLNDNELIREGNYLNPELLDSLKSVFNNKLPDGIEFQNKIRKEWDSRL